MEVIVYPLAKSNKIIVTVILFYSLVKCHLLLIYVNLDKTAAVY